MEEYPAPYFKKRRRARLPRFLLFFFFLLCFLLLTAVLLQRFPLENSVLARFTSKEKIATQTNASTSQAAPNQVTATETALPYKTVDISAKALGMRYENKTDYEIENAYYVTAPAIAGTSVLIVATRGYEAYCESENGISYTDKNTETLGQYLCKSLQELGVDACFLPVSEDGNYTYENAGNKMAAYLSEHSEIGLVIDISREVLEEDGVYLRPVTAVDNTVLAQLRLAVGTDAGGGNHPDWRYSLRNADALFSLLFRSCDTLMMPTLISTARLNQHIHPCMITLHIGSFANSYEEAQASACLFAELLAGQIKASDLQTTSAE